MYLTFTDSENMGNKLSLLDDYSMHLAQLQILSLQYVVNLSIGYQLFITDWEYTWEQIFIFRWKYYYAKLPNLSYRNCRKQTNKIP